MAYIGKTNWTNNEIVEAVDMNRIEQGILDADVGLGNVQAEVTTHKADNTAHGIDTKIPKTLATAANQFLVSSAASNWVVKTIAQVKELLGLGSAAYTESSAYAPSSHINVSASTSAKGHVQLSTSTTSTSTALAATSSAVKAAMDKANEAFQSASEQIKIKPNITILATGWVDDTANSGYWLYNIADADITADTVVDVNIHLAYLEKAESIKSANLSSAGKVTIYADEKPVENIVADLKLIRQVSV